MPGVQKPHCEPPVPRKADTSSDRTCGSSPSTVVTTLPATRSTGVTFRRFEPFRARAARAGEPGAPTRAALRDGLLLTPAPGAIQALLDQNPDYLTLVLPGLQGGVVELELTRVNLFAEGFRAVASDAPTLPMTLDRAGHYRGIVRGDRDSLAAVSVFHDEIMGIYRTAADGAVVLGRVEGGARGEHRHESEHSRDGLRHEDAARDGGGTVGTRDDDADEEEHLRPEAGRVVGDQTPHEPRGEEPVVEALVRREHLHGRGLLRCGAEDRPPVAFQFRQRADGILAQDARCRAAPAGTAARYRNRG